jgi:hypothetical protein
MKLRTLFAITAFAAALPALALNCAPNYTVIGTNCAFFTNFAWAAAGGGADSIVTLYVPPEASGPVNFQITGLSSSMGSAYTGYLGIMAGELGQPGKILTFADILANEPGDVFPGKAQQFLVSQVCWDPTCTTAAPAGAVGNMFSLQLTILSPSVPDLNVTPNPLLTIQFLSGTQVTFEETSNARPIPGRNISYIPGISLGPTPAGRYVYNGAAVTQPFDEFSVTNESTTGPITGSVTIEDINGNPIATAGIQPIPMGGAAGFLLIGRSPGDALGLFPSTTVLPAGGDGLFHGILVVTMSGPNIVTAQELYGNAFLNLLVFH